MEGWVPSQPSRGADGAAASVTNIIGAPGERFRLDTGLTWHRGFLTCDHFRSGVYLAEFAGLGNPGSNPSIPIQEAGLA